MSLYVNGTSYRSFHLVGICGSGMSAIAQYLAWLGCDVSGSDRLENDGSVFELKQGLQACGCRLLPQDGRGVTESVHALIVSTAIESSNPDIRIAQQRGIPILHRADVVSAICDTKKTIAVAGTSGKSTVTALLFHVLSSLGMEPSLLSGANLNSLMQKGFVGNAFFGNGEFLVIEADESDGSLVKYKPFVSLFLNVSKDHKPVLETIELFRVLSQQSKHVFINADDEQLRNIPFEYSFALRRDPAWCKPDSFACTLKRVCATFGKTTVCLPYPGEHNASNLIAAVSITRFLGHSVEAIATVSESYQGIARRYEQYNTTRGTTVIDDYGHNPEKVKASLQTAQAQSEKVIALFQPHGFGPLKFLFQEFADMFGRCLRDADQLILLPVYYAGGTVSQEVNSNDLASAIKTRCSVHAVKNRFDAVELVKQNAEKNDIVLLMGARDPTLKDFAQSIIHALNP